MDISHKKKIIKEKKDVLGEKILSSGREPEFNEICGLIKQRESWDFIGTEKSKWKFLIGNDGKIIIETTVPLKGYRTEVYCAFDPEKENMPYSGQKGKQSLLEGWLPVNITDFGKWKQQSFVWTEENKSYIYIRVSGPEKEIYTRAEEPETEILEELIKTEYASPTPLQDGKEWKEKIKLIKKKWTTTFRNGMEVNIPEKNLYNGARAGIIKSYNTCVGKAIRYGATRYFRDTGRNAESFAPTTTCMAECCLEWGHFKKATTILDHFLDNFVTDDGELIHRGNGASISEHGMLLEVMAKYHSYTGNEKLTDKYESKLKNIALALISKRKENDDSEPSGRGLIKGCPEDDLRSWPPDYWYSCNCWACRGLKEAGKLFKETGHTEFAEDILREAENFRKDIISSIKKAEINGFIPPCPEIKKPFDDFMEKSYYKDCENDNLLFPSYASYRIYPEMLSAGILDRKTFNKIVLWREKHGAEFLGSIKFRMKDDFRINNWPIFNCLRGLLEHNMRRKFLMALYSHMAIHQSRTTFFAPEGTWLDKLDSIHCVPSQLVVPLALKWMLVYEERDSSKLRLCGGIPLEWLKKGKPVSVKNAPVKGGKISFSVKKNPRKEELNLSVEFSEKNRTIPEEIIFHLNIADKKSGNDDSTLTIKTENRKKIDVSFPVTKI